MNVHETALHLDGHEPVEAAHAPHTDALVIGAPLDSVRLVLGHDLTLDTRVAFLEKLATAASDLADEITLRDLEATA